MRTTEKKDHAEIALEPVGILKFGGVRLEIKPPSRS